MSMDSAPPAERPAAETVDAVTAQSYISNSCDSSARLISPADSVRTASDNGREESDVLWWQVHRWQRASILKLVLLAVLIVAVIVVFAVLPVWKWLDAFSAWSEKDENTAVGMLSMMGLYAILTVLCFPGAILTILAGLLFGVVKGSVVVLIGATVGAALAFLVGRYIFKDFVDRSFTHRYPALKAVNAVISRAGFKCTFLIRLSPVIPFNALNYCLALTSVAFWPYVTASFLGMAPGVVLYVYLGSTARSVKDILDGKVKGDARTTLFFYLGLFITLLLAVLLARLAQDQIRKEMARTDDGEQAEEPWPETEKGRADAREDAKGLQSK